MTIENIASEGDYDMHANNSVSSESYGSFA